jgi:hypothetical protein
MGKWRECLNCGEASDGDMIYFCTEDNHVFCQQCGNWTPNLFGNHNCICPRCNSTSNVRILGEVDTASYDYEAKCSNCGNVDDADWLYKCKEDDLLFCRQCGDSVYNINGYHNCICPICHSTSPVRILGEIGEDEKEEDEGEDIDEADNSDEGSGDWWSDGRSVEEIYGPDDSNEEGSNGDEDEDYEYSSHDSSDNYSSGSNERFEPSTSYSGTYTSNTSGAPFVIGALLIVLSVVGLVYLIDQNKFDQGNEYNSRTVTYQTDVQSFPPPQPVNPYGEGQGRITFYKTCVYCQNIEISYNGMIIGSLTDAPLHDEPTCDGIGGFPINIAGGSHTFTMTNESGETWEQMVTVAEGECVRLKVHKSLAIHSEELTDIFDENDNLTGTFEILVPADHAEYDYPRYTDVTFTSVENAEYYEVELQLADDPYNYTATSFSAPPYDNGGIYKTTSTSVTVQGMGMQVHRVRVRAMVGLEILAETEWRYFNYRE